jgi:hypothetical protein
MGWMSEQVSTGVLRLGEITQQADLAANLEENAVPAFIGDVSAVNYPDFLEARRKLMARIIHQYYESL